MFAIRSCIALVSCAFLALGSAACSAICAASVAPNSRQAAAEPAGCHLPTIIAAMATLSVGVATSEKGAEKELQLDYKNVYLIKQFISERGKIVPRRISGTCAKHQRKLTEAIKRARNIVAKGGAEAFHADAGGRFERQLDLLQLALERALLQASQQLGLAGQRDFADLVEKDGPPVGQFKPSDLSPDRSGKGAFFMTKELAL